MSMMQKISFVALALGLQATAHAYQVTGVGDSLTEGQACLKAQEAAEQAAVCYAYQDFSSVEESACVCQEGYFELTEGYVHGWKCAVALNYGCQDN